MPGQESSPERIFYDMEQKQSSFRAPEPVHAYLDELVGRAGITRATRREVIAALIASCDLEGEDLATLVMTYREAHAADLPISTPQSAES